MTQISIQTQVEAIKKTTKEAGKSKETAMRFLEDAGILKTKSDESKTDVSQKKK